MNAIGMIELVVALAVVASALAAFNALVGKGPRGTVLLVAACVFTWSSALPGFLTESDSWQLSKSVVLMIEVLQLCGIVGFIVGIVDALQKRTNHGQHSIAEYFVRQPLVWGAVFYCNFFGLLYQGVFHSPLLMRYCAGHLIANSR